MCIYITHLQDDLRLTLVIKTKNQININRLNHLSPILKLKEYFINYI